ncbi:dTDP-4-dehydrorhamnose reductase [Aneurinibacillus uraniidurans]|uniref:dTDP-4-dehydrorhamnose reductase n=1 Tax=Aneurinibacillus uraniidurans TaxID=2966586 RepID=UPI00234BBE5F|nr:dTDP-4-dehydrorhamnose reductase [Aneurinibacillus sp. B1]WCN38100.1 dTDP-4-dehydrorhamnose reductase [Aneurinibacillus sp. B1]
MVKVLVTGGNGQLGTDVALLLKRHSYDVYAYGRDRLDITNQSQVQDVVRQIQPDVIIHTAAYTKVDQAETDSDMAYLVNAVGTRNIAVEAERYQAKLIYISTDYVFDGTADTPYSEFASVNPVSMYGKSKWAGEEFVRQLCSRFFIVRTSWVYGKHGHNFVKTMLRLAETRNELRVVHDQIGSPTYTVDLALFLLQLLQTEAYGTYHASNSGVCSWYEFACAIFEEAGLSHIQVHPIPTAEYPLPAPRPAYSVLDHMMIRLQNMSDLRHWREGLQSFLKEL